MNFQFDVNLNDRDYLDYNTFWMLRSPYGKKQVKTFRITITALFVAFIFLFLFGGQFTAGSFLGLIPIVIVFTFAQAFLNKFFVWSLKGQMKTLKKSGKMGYSPNSVMEFSEDRFVETTPYNKTEHRYSAVERVSVVDNKTMYIHVNNVMAYILPLSCFASKEQYDDFFAFIETKCANVETYMK